MMTLETSNEKHPTLPPIRTGISELPVLMRSALVPAKRCKVKTTELSIEALAELVPPSKSAKLQASPHEAG